MTERILVAEDEEILNANLCEFLQRAGHVADGVLDGETALRRVLEEDFGVVVADIRMPGLDGISLLKRIVAERPETFVLVTTAYASIDSAIEALRFGAYDYMLKPVVPEDLLQKVHNLAAYRAMQGELGRLRRQMNDRLGFEGMVGESPAMREVFEQIERVAPTRSNVLVTGESGTGKELVARAIHARSMLADREFLGVNMAAVPDEMVEAQLFGHEKGAYTGADRRREGVLRSVRGGTVFLDEIGDLPLASQAKLLRAIESREVMPVGADRPVAADFRLIAATNQDLGAATESGRFRKDLLFRLDVFRIAIPPLRERREDIPALVSHFETVHARDVGKKPRGTTNEAMRLLLDYGWPGNVRELSNVIERATILCGDGPIDAAHLPPELQSRGPMPTALRAAVQEFERRHVAWVLRAAGGNREKAAKMLEVDPATLYRRLAKYGSE